MRMLFLALVLGAGAGGPVAAASKTIYRIETVAGIGSLGDGGPAVAAQIGDIHGLAADRFGNLYLSDTDHHRVRKVDANGVITVIAGTGAPGFSGDGGPALQAALNLPYGLAVDPNGNVFIADLGNGRVRRVSPDGKIATFAGGGDAPLLSPRNIALDAEGNLFVSEFEGHRVRKINRDGQISTLAGTGKPGFDGDGGAATVAQLRYPAGLAVGRDGAVYVADSQNQRVRKILPEGTIVTVLGGSAETALFTPTAVAMDTAGTVYLADQSHTVRAYNAAGVWRSVAGTGEAGFGGDGGPARMALLNTVNDLAVDPYGYLYLADGARIRKVTGAGLIQTVAGDAYCNVGDGGAAVDAQLLRPSAVGLDVLGNLLIADTGLQRIRRVSPSGQMATLAGTGFSGFSGDGAPAAQAQFRNPVGLAVDVWGNVSVADAGNHRVRQVGADGRIRTVAGTGSAGAGPEGLGGTQTPLRDPQGLCTGSEGALYVLDTGNHRVLRVPPGGAVAIVAGNGSPGDSGDGGPAIYAQLRQPAACAFDTAGNLFIADTGNHRIRKVTPGGSISTVAGAGVPGFAGDGGRATAALLHAPAGIALDGDGNLYLADTGNDVVRQVARDGNIQTIAGDTVRLRGPSGLVRDGWGNLYLADTGNDVIRRLVPEVVDIAEPAKLPALSAVNAASLLPGPVAPGEQLTILGTALGPDGGLVGTPDSAGLLPTLLGDAEVRFDGAPAPVFYLDISRITVQAPYSIAGVAATFVEIRSRGRSAGALTLPVVDAAPGLFPAIANQDGSLNSPSRPAARDSIITVYGTGEGLTDGPNISGKISAPPYARPRLSLILTIGGMPAEILYAGSAPGLVATFQVNARVPGGFIPAGQAAVQVTVGGAASPVVAVWLE